MGKLWSKRTRVRFQSGVAAVGLGLALLTACGDDGGSGGDGVEFKFAMGSSGAQGAFYQEAMERANDEYGYRGEWVELTGSETAVAGIASDKFQFGAGVAATVMAAQQSQDAKVTFIGDFVKMLWTLVGTTDITTCEDLDGKRFGLHSPGGVSTAIFNAWFSENCADDVKPEIIYIEGSPNRLQGLLADQLDATMLEIDDDLELTDDFHIMVNFADELPDIEANTVFANDEFLKDHPEVATNLLSEVSKLAAEVNDDPSVLADAIREFRPELADRADDIAQAYVDAGVFVADGSMSTEELQKTIDLYVVAEAIEPGLEVDQIADRKYLDDALAKS